MEDLCVCVDIATVVHHYSFSTLSWLETQFAEMGLEIYSQNFTATVPVSHSAQVSVRFIFFTCSCLYFNLSICYRSPRWQDEMCMVF